MLDKREGRKIYSFCFFYRIKFLITVCGILVTGIGCYMVHTFSPGGSISGALSKPPVISGLAFIVIGIALFGIAYHLCKSTSCCEEPKK